MVPGISGAAFAQRNRVLSVDADYAWSEATTLSAGYARRKGDVTPTTQRNLPIFEASTAIAADPAFGNDWFAYRLPATTHVLSARWSRALGLRASLNFGIERQISYGSGGNDYTNTVGFGLRYQTPVGPVRVDIGHNLNPSPGLKSTEIFVTLGQSF